MNYRFLFIKPVYNIHWFIVQDLISSGMLLAKAVKVLSSAKLQIEVISMM